MREGMVSKFRELCRWEVAVRLGWSPMSRRHLDWITWSESVVVGGGCGVANRG